MRTRLALNYKGIDYTQTFLSYPDIKPTLQSLDYPAKVDSDKDGDHYTCPAIYHPESLANKVPGGKVMTESWDIVNHLEDLFPTPTLFPEVEGSTRAETIELAKQAEKLFGKALGFRGGRGGVIVIPRIPEILDPRGREYFIRTRNEGHPKGIPLEKWGSEDPEDDWKAFEAALEPVAELLQARGGPFLLGETFSYGDAIIVAQLVWFKSADQKYYERMSRLYGGGFARLFDRVKREGWMREDGEEKEWPVMTDELSKL